MFPVLPPSRDAFSKSTQEKTYAYEKQRRPDVDAKDARRHADDEKPHTWSQKAKTDEEDKANQAPFASALRFRL